MENLKVEEKITGLKISGAEAVVKCLLAEGVDLIFGYPGGAIMPVYDAMYDYQKEFILDLKSNRFVISKFARQSGKSSCVIAFIVWYIIFTIVFFLS